VGGVGGVAGLRPGPQVVTQCRKHARYPRCSSQQPQPLLLPAPPSLPRGLACRWWLGKGQWLRVLPVSWLSINVMARDGLGGGGRARGGDSRSRVEAGRRERRSPGIPGDLFNRQAAAPRQSSPNSPKAPKPHPKPNPPHAEHARRPPLRVRQPPQLAAPQRLLQYALGCEVKGRRGAAGGVDPVDGALAVAVLGAGRGK
jgi:hypothetical protein